MNLGYLISAIIGLLGYGAFQTIQKWLLQAKLKNIDVKQAIAQKQASIDQNAALLAQEEQKRQQQQQTSAQPTDPKDLVDFFNNKGK